MSVKYILSFFIIVAVSLMPRLSAYGQEIQIERIITIEPEEIHEICVLEPLDYDAHFKFRPALNSLKATASDGGATFEINFINNCGEKVWPEEAKEAFRYAAEIWGSHLSSTIPISINATWRSLGANTLGSAGPAILLAFADPGSGMLPDTFYPIAQVNALLGRDIKEQDNVSVTRDITVNISCDRQNWYFGTDTNTPPGQFDLVTVLLHEIGHGIGFLGSVSANNNAQTASWGSGGSQNQNAIPFIYDQFTLDGNFDSLINIEIYPIDDIDDFGANVSPSLYPAATGRVGGGVFFSGLDAEFSIDNVRVPLWSPNLFQGGSSYSHLDQNFFSTNGQYANSALMRPSIPTALAIHSPGPVFCGMLKDMNWPLGPACELLIEDTGPIERPILAFPGNGTTGQTTKPQLVWNDSPGATEYRVQISTNFSHTNIVFDETVSGTSVSVNDPLDLNTLHFWRVRAINGSGTSNWSSSNRFTTQLGLPDRVTLSSPSDGAIHVQPGFDLLWQNVPGSSDYELQVAESTDFIDPVIDVIQSNNDYSNVQGLEYSTTYYWRVRASSSLGQTEWSEIWSFTMIIERPEAVTVALHPSDNQNQIPLLADFIWDPSKRAVDYDIQISKSENFSTLSITGSVTEPSFRNTVTLEPAQVYFWRVRAFNIGGASDWSEPFTFTSVVDETKIDDNFPNPFNTATNLRYQLSNQTNVLIDLFDIGGRRVAVLVNGEQAPGVYIETLQAYPFASGTYLLRFAADGVMDVQKMTIIK